MKKLFYIVVSLGVAVACQSEKISPESGEVNKEQMEFEARVAETRSVLNAMTPEWSKGETIYLFNNTQKEIYTGQNEAQSATTKFKGNALDGGAFLAVSPTSAVGNTSKADVSNKTITNITIKTEQTATVGTYDPKAFIAVAYTEDNILTFDAAVSLLKFKMGSDGVTEVTFAGWNEEKLTGSGIVSYNSEGKPIVTVNEKTYVKLKGTFKKGSTYYVAVAPNSFSKLPSLRYIIS